MKHCSSSAFALMFLVSCLTSLVNFRVIYRLERKVVLGSCRSSGNVGSVGHWCSFGRSILCCGSCGNSGCCLRSLYSSRGRLTSCNSGNGGLRTPSVDVVKPAAVVFVGINIERDGIFLSHLQVHLVEAVFAENAEDAMARVLVFVPFNDELLALPRIAAALTDTAARL